MYFPPPITWLSDGLYMEKQPHNPPWWRKDGQERLKRGILEKSCMTCLILMVMWSVKRAHCECLKQQCNGTNPDFSGDPLESPGPVQSSTQQITRVFQENMVSQHWIVIFNVCNAPHHIATQSLFYLRPLVGLRVWCWCWCWLMDEFSRLHQSFDWHL